MVWNDTIIIDQDVWKPIRTALNDKRFIHKPYFRSHIKQKLGFCIILQITLLLLSYRNKLVID